MKKYIGYIPAALFTTFYLVAGLTGASITMSMALFWLACFWIAAFLLHKGLVWGEIFGLIPGLHMILIGDGELIIGQIRLTRTGRTNPEYDRILFDCVHVIFLSDRFAFDCPTLLGPHGL